MAFNSLYAVLIFIAFFVAIIVAAALKKIFYYFRFKKRYYIFPRPSVHGIANIAMVIALSVAVLLLLTFVTSNAFSVLFRAFPGSRITIEGILIKIGGLLFGPFIGMFIGGITDLLSILMTAGVFHYGYFISAMAYGLLAGLIRTVFTFSKEHKIWNAITASITSLVACGLFILFLYLITGSADGLNQTLIPFLPETITTQTLVYIFAGFTASVLCLIWILFFFSNHYQKWKIKRSSQKHFRTKQYRKVNKSYFSNFCLILVCCVVTEILINVLLMPSFDADLSTLSYDNWFLIRVAIFIPMVIFNFIIIYPVYVIISPIVTWDYRAELVEDYSIPFYAS